LWKEFFDRLDSRVGPTLNNVAKSDDFTAATALVRRTRRAIERRFEEASSRMLHAFNLPAGTDVHRLLVHVAQLEADLRGIRTQLADREHAEFLAQLEAEHAAKSATTSTRSGPPRRTATAAAQKAGAKKVATPRSRSAAVKSPGDTSGE
jgi:hypothetical protein